MSALDQRQGQSQRQATRAAGGGGGGGGKKKKPNRRDHGGGGGGGHRRHDGGGGGGGKGDGKTPDKLHAPKLPFAPGGQALGMNLPLTGAIPSNPAAMGYASLPLYSAPAAPRSHPNVPRSPVVPGQGQPRSSVLNTAGQSSNPFSLQAAANSAGLTSGGAPAAAPAPAAPKAPAPITDPYAKTATVTTNPVTGNTPLAKAATSANPLAAAAAPHAAKPAAPGQPYGPTPMGGTLAQQYRGQAGGGGGNPYGGGSGPIFSDKNPYEQTEFKDQPEAGFRAALQTAGIDAGGQDALGKYMANQFPELQMGYKAALTDSKNQNLSFMDWVLQQGGAQYGKPTWMNDYRNFWLQKYRNASMDERGLNYSPYEGQSRWLAIG